MNRLVARSVFIMAAAGTFACGSGTTSSKPTLVGNPQPQPETSTSLEPAAVTQTAQPQELVFPDEDFRATQPAPAKPRPFQLPAVNPFVLKNGITVYLVEQHTLPIVSMNLTFDGGSVIDPPGKEGLAAVCMDMMSEGTARLDKLAYSEALADVASVVSSSAEGDIQGVSMQSLTKHLDTTFGLFVETLLTPGFRAEDFDRMIKRRLEALKQTKGSPAAVASRVVGPVLYGSVHPNGRIITEGSLAAITLDDCRAYHAKQLKPLGARLFVVGDLTAAQIRERFESGALADWRGKAPALPAMPKPAKAAARIYFVHVPNAAQSQITLAHFGPLRTAPDYLPNFIMSAILGGGFTSRVNMNLREEKGYSYGASAGFLYTRNYGVMAAGASVRTDATYQSLLELEREVKAMESGTLPVTDEEFAQESSSMLLGLPSRFATAGASLAQFRTLVYFGLPLDYWAKFTAKLQKVTKAQVALSARTHLQPAKAVYVVVGDGNAPMIVRNADKKDVPFLVDGEPVTLRGALERLASEGTLGSGGLRVLDADAQLVP